MSLKQLFGLDEVFISDAEIMAKIKEAFEKDLDTVEFIHADGSKVVVRLPHIDFAKYVDPWDGKGLGRGAA